MRVLVVTHNYPRFAGDPAGAFVARLAGAAAAAGHEVRVIAPHVADTPVAEECDGVTVHRFRYAPVALERVGYRGDLHRRALTSPVVALGIPSFLLAFRAALRRAAREFRPHVTHAHWWLPGGWLASRSEVPFVVTCHGSDVRLLDRSLALRRLAGSVFRRAVAVTAVSEFLARDVRHRFPQSAARVIALPMPIDVARFSAGCCEAKVDPPRILYAGNLVASKGVADLVDAYGILRARGVRCELKILGEGPERAALRSRAEGRGDGVVWSDFVPQGAMPAELGRSTVTVLPTRGQHEGLGLSLVEALLAGCAVVGTRAGGIPEVVIHERTGLLARAGDPADLAAQLERMLLDHELRARLTAAGRAMVEERFAADRAAARYLSLYDAVADGQNAR